MLRAWQFEATLGSTLDEHAELVRPSLLRQHAGRPRRSPGPQVGRAAGAADRRCSTGCGSSSRVYDALLLPVAPLPAFDAGLQYPETVAGEPQPDYLGWMRTVCHVTVTGHPAMSMPAGFTGTGTPVGVQIVGRHRAERELLGIAEGLRGRDGVRSDAAAAAAGVVGLPVGRCVRRPTRSQRGLRPRRLPDSTGGGWYWTPSVDTLLHPRPAMTRPGDTTPTDSKR